MKETQENGPAIVEALDGLLLASVSMVNTVNRAKSHINQGNSLAGATDILNGVHEALGNVTSATKTFKKTAPKKSK